LSLTYRYLTGWLGFAGLTRRGDALAGKLGELEAAQAASEARQSGEVAEVKGLVETKPEVKDVNRSLLRLSEAVDAKFSMMEELVQMKPDMPLAVIGARDGSNPISTAIGRWIFKNRDVDAVSRLVPWTHQSCNTSPGGFHWTPGCQRVTVSMPGLYEVSAGFFFSPVAPSVQLIVNDEVVILGSTSAIKGSQGQTRAGDPSGVGCTLLDFISLPQNALIGVVFNGSSGAEGFLGLRKM